MATNEDNVEVLSDYPLGTGETQTETETPQTDEATTEPETVEAEKPENRKEIETLQAQKEHWRKKYQELDKKTKSSTAEPQDDEFRSRVEFLLENRDINADEYDHLAATALRKLGKVDLEALREAKESETEYISFLRKKVESKNKIPSSTAVGGFASLLKSPEEIAKMTPAEHAKYDALLMAEQDKRGGQI